MNLDLALRVSEPNAITELSMLIEKFHFENWESLNYLSLKFVKSKQF
ncbi:hypothetical protein Pint_18744 [Pistacia integerrima]|uniref:Uncharacterized protein n=1 Tax=Pistacia integerrima TaxID=434235 RepID=A0ACC0YVX9_9ROSI|nr:hypothetical protein Pint_18744 [Pistacia integerrima]